MRLLFACCLSFLTATACAGETRIVLLSAEQNVAIESFDTSKLPDSAAGYTISVEELHGGKQEGCSLIHIDNGRIKVTVVPNRGMSVLSVFDAQTGQRIFGWDSPVKEVVNPAYIDLESRGGLGWLEGFNEWMVRCGLEFAGHPGLDKFTTNTGDTAEMNLTLHGKIGNVPASEVELVIDEEDPHTLTLRGVVHERLFFGPKLRLTTELRMTPGSPKVDLVDEVTNLGASPQEYQLIYHANFGAPILEEGARVQVAAEVLMPMNETAAAGIDRYDTYDAPTAGYLEQVFLVQPVSDEQGRSTALLHNKAGDRGAAIIWETKTLPYLTIWKNTVAEADGYVTGIEPATGYPFNRGVERHYGRVPKLEPGESKSFSVSFVALTSNQMVKRVANAVDALRATTTMMTISEPPETDFDEK